MYVYLKTGTSQYPLYTVGFYDPAGNFIPEDDYDSKERAAKRVNYLNGGSNETQRTALIKAVAGHLYVANELLYIHKPDACFDVANRTAEFVDELLSQLR